jgi:hypothetical protein
MIRLRTSKTRGQLRYGMRTQRRGPVSRLAQPDLLIQQLHRIPPGMQCIEREVEAYGQTNRILRGRYVGHRQQRHQRLQAERSERESSRRSRMGILRFPVVTRPAMKSSSSVSAAAHTRPAVWRE